MASLFKMVGRRGNGQEHLEEFKQTGTSGGQPVYAPVLALEPLSIGGGGSTDVTDRAARLLGHVTVDNATLAVTQSGSWTSDVTDRAARLLGHVTVDNASLAVTKSGTWPIDTAAKGTTVAGYPTSEATDANTQSLHSRITNASLPVTGTFWQATQPVSGPLTDTQLRASAVTVDVNDRAARLLGHITVDNATLAVTQSGTWNVVTQTPVPVSDNAGSITVDAPVGTPVFARLSDGAAALIGQKTMALSLPITLATDQSVLPAVAEIRASTLMVTGTAAVNTGVTVTLPAAGAGLFHYITSIEVVKLYSVVGVAAGAGVIITSTNMPGTPAWTTEQLASAAGTAARVVTFAPATPLKSSVANTATTIVCPAQLQTIWRVNVTYFTAA